MRKAFSRKIRFADGHALALRDRRKERSLRVFAEQFAGTEEGRKHQTPTPSPGFRLL